MLKKIGLLLDNFTEVYNVGRHSAQQLGKRWSRGEVVLFENDMLKLEKMKAPIKFFVEFVEPKTEKVVDDLSSKKTRKKNTDNEG